jgi:CheY-like chemotaxis protein
MSPFEELRFDGSALAPVGTPVISCWLPGEVAAASELGIVRYLMKPITREKLRSVLDEIVPELKVTGDVTRVLVADDEPDELHLFARMLESAKAEYQVIQVMDGKRALDVLRTRKPDILLLDLMMPVMDGFQVLIEKQKDSAIRDVPVIVISSRDPQGDAIASATIRLSHSGGFLTNHLLEIIYAVSEIVTPEQPGADGTLH